MSQTLKRPDWLKKKISNVENIDETFNILKRLKLNTVCDSAMCPNIGECYGHKTATFMILGNVCTRVCRFCAVPKGRTEMIDVDEPRHIGEACKELGLKHVVVTSVTRDDLKDGGAQHFANVVYEIRKSNPHTTIELLIPDLKGNWDALKIIVDAKPDILNHNTETIKSLYSLVRPVAIYERSLELLKKVKEMDPNIYTKSGIMLGLGECESEVYELMDDLRNNDVDIMTMGQYLQPTSKHLEVKEYVHPDKFEHYRLIAEEKGFLYVASGPFVRSSYNAAIGIDKIRTHK